MRDLAPEPKPEAEARAKTILRLWFTLKVSAPPSYRLRFHNFSWQFFLF
jgi:hypothetical protein